MPSIYYKLLLPFDLEQILRTNKAKSPTLTFNPFPIKEDAIIALMLTFLSNRKKQVSTAERTFDLQNPDEKSKKIISDQLKNGIAPLSVTLYGTLDNPFENAFDIPSYLYVNTSDGFHIPVQCGQMTSVSTDHPYAISVNGKKYYDCTRIIICKDKVKFVIGKSITIEYPNTAEISGVRIFFSERGPLSARIRDYEFWIAVRSGKSCHISCGDIFDCNSNEDYDPDYLDAIVGRLNSLKDIKKALDYFGAKDDLNLEQFDEKDKVHLSTLIQASRGRELSIKIDKFNPISCIEISNLCFLVYIVKLRDGKYKMYNAFHIPEPGCTIRCTSDQPKEECMGSPYLFMHKQIFIKTSNIDYDVMFESIVSFPVVPLYRSLVTLFLLEVISAYDHKKSDDLVNFADKISDWLLKVDASEPNQLNRLQVKKRQRSLERKEQDSLRNMILNSEYTISKIGACVLLESFFEARTLWDDLPEQERKVFLNMPCCPILNLWLQNKPDDLTMKI
ncbi:MAG: hypothetical protein LBM75_08715 [Myxococcales bacterium]|jgi:hypothetical protein|nr:hypothetical protein [Myxococcales bacterium]